MYVILIVVLFLFLTCDKCQGAFRLEDLRESYSEAYPKRQYISPNFTRGAPNVNVQKFDLVWRRCQEPCLFSPLQFQRLKTFYGEEVVLNETISDILYQPRARIFSGDNYDTKFEEYHIALAGSGGCFNLKEQKPLKLVKTWGKCIRVFKYPDCFGWTLAIYPGSVISQKKLKGIKFTEIRSIGPCFSDEFLSSSLKPDKESEVAKNTQFKNHNPDLIELPLFSEMFFQLLIKTKKHIANPWGIYKSGHKNRMLEIYAMVQRKSIDEAQASNIWRTNEKFHGNETEEGDVLIYVIPPKFGGPTNQSWNVFLGSKSTAQIWANVSSNFPSPTKDSEPLQFILNFIYKDGIKIRPLFLYYSAWTTGFISYGRVLNGHRDNLKNTEISDNLNAVGKEAEEVERSDEVEASFFQRHARLEKMLQGGEMSRDENSTIRNVNHRKNQVWKCSAESKLFFSQFQENYLKHESAKMEAQSGALHRMVGHTIARFYTGVDYTGAHEDFTLFNVNAIGLCYDLRKVKNRVESVGTFGTCIRVFMGPHCTTDSIVIYPQSPENKALYFSEIRDKFNLSDIVSVGSCFWGEMSESYFTPNQKFVPKIILPPFLKFLNWENIKIGKSIWEAVPIAYGLGKENRTEFVSTRIEAENNLDFSQKDKPPVCFKNEEGKHFCYAIPQMINDGHRNQSYNIFETVQDAMEDWTRIISEVHGKKHGKYFFSVKFQYDEDNNSTTPTRLIYYILHQTSGISYGYVFNGLRNYNSYHYTRKSWRLTNFYDDYTLFSLLRS